MKTRDEIEHWMIEIAREHGLEWEVMSSYKAELRTKDVDTMTPEDFQIAANYALFDWDI